MVANAGSMTLTVLKLITEAAGLAEELTTRAALRTAFIYTKPWQFSTKAA